MRGSVCLVLGYSISKKEKLSKALGGKIELSIGTVNLKINKKNPEGEYDEDL